MAVDQVLRRVPTGISGFDQVALGGLPAGRCTLVTGTVGSGKSLSSVEFLARGIELFDEPGVFVTFEEAPEDIRLNAASLGFDIAGWEHERKWIFVDASLSTVEPAPTVGTYDFGPLVARIGYAVHQVGARRISLDPLSTVLTRFPEAATVRAELLRVTVAVGIMAVDAKGIIRSCNPAAEQLLARPSHDLVGLPLGFPTVVDDTRIIDVRQSDGGFRTVEMRVSITVWDGRPLYITALHEPTHTEAELNSALQHQANALALIALELENPLAEINRAVHQLRHGTAGTGGHHTEYIDRIDERTQYLLAVVRRLRAATGIDPEQIPASIEPVRVFDVILERLHELRKKSRSVRLRCDAGIVVYVDRTDFAQMLDSYLHNALVHGHPPVDLQAIQQGKWVDLRVCDQGQGVAEASRPQLFERYGGPADGPQHGDGTTPELWITRILARAHGGDAWYEPHQPHGACFCLRLPATPPTAP